jgi:hypothetical protein
MLDPIQRAQELRWFARNRGRATTDGSCPHLPGTAGAFRLGTVLTLGTGFLTRHLAATLGAPGRVGVIGW